MAYFPHSFLMPFWFFLFSGETGDCWPESMPDDMGDTSDSVDSSVFSDFAEKTKCTRFKSWRFTSYRKFQSLQFDIFPVLRHLMKGSQNNPRAKWFALKQERHQTVNSSGVLHCVSQRSDVYPPAVKSSSFQRGAEACMRGWRETQCVIVLELFANACFILLGGYILLEWWLCHVLSRLTFWILYFSVSSESSKSNLPKNAENNQFHKCNCFQG